MHRAASTPGRSGDLTAAVTTKIQAKRPAWATRPSAKSAQPAGHVLTIGGLR